MGNSPACFDDACGAPADRELNGFEMCTPHYIEALEHGAHILSTPAGVLTARERKREEQLLRPIKERLAERQREKEKREEETGRPSNDYSTAEEGPGCTCSPAKKTDAIRLSGESSSPPAAAPKPPSDAAA